MSSTPTSRATGLDFRDVQVDVEKRADGTMILRNTRPLTVPTDRFYDYLKLWAHKTPDAIFMAERAGDGWRKISYKEAWAQVRAIASALLTRNLSPDRPVMILSGNGIDHQLVGLASMLAGVPYAPLSVAYSTISQDFGKLKDIMTRLNPGLVFVTHAAPFARALTIPEMAGREIVIGTGAETVPGATPFAELLKGGSGDVDAQDAKNTSDTIAKFLFTSGSTGVPKGVITTHKMMCSNLDMMTDIWPFVTRRPPVVLDWLPWSHVFGGTFCVGLVMKTGGTFYVDDGKPMPTEAPKTLRNLREISPTLYWSVPKGFEVILAEMDRDPAFAKCFFADLDIMFYAGASLPEPVMRGLETPAQNTVGKVIPMLTSWGLTETAPSITTVNRLRAGTGNVGVPNVGLELKLIPNGEKLEARVRGPSIMPGYWKMPEQTHGAFDDEGFFITGDAMLFMNMINPGMGLRFDGRVSEDFKLLTGTWVNVGGMRGKISAALAGIVSDFVIAGADRDDLGLIMFPLPTSTRSVEETKAAAQQALREHNKTAAGSSEKIARAILADLPPSLDAGEITDKGSLNSRLILTRRDHIVAKLYDANDPDVIKM